MSVLEAILYGILQGITEFLPVSSSGHLSLAQNFFGAQNLEENYLTFTVLLHLGTLLAVFIVYYKDIWMLIKGFISLIKRVFTGRFKEKLEYGERLFLLLAAATLPLIPAALMEGYLSSLSRISWLIGVFLIINGLMLLISDKLSNQRTTIKNGTAKNAFTVGLMQLFGIFPGISRSGSTITGGLFTGFSREEAVKFSFLLSIPAILGANILKISELVDNPLPEGTMTAVIAGVAAALLSGLAAIKLLQYISKSKKLSVFTIYCILLGVTAIIADIFI